jgi:hypothetical protein
VAKVQSEFDELRRKVQDRYFRPGGTPGRLRGNGQHVTLFEYDAFGNVTALRYLDESGRPTLGYAKHFDATWQLCGRWMARYAEGKLVGNGECQKELPSP